MGKATNESKLNSSIDESSHCRYLTVVVVRHKIEE